MDQIEVRPIRRARRRALLRRIVGDRREKSPSLKGMRLCCGWYGIHVDDS